MNISFYDGINDGKFYSINAGKYDELGEEDIDISEGVNEEIEDEDGDTCLNRFTALEKDASKLHMDLNNLRNEFRGSCKDWNNLSDTVDHMLNSIAELKAIMDRADDRLNKRLNVISEANVVLTDKLNLVEKKLEVFKCIDILDRVTKLEEQVDRVTKMEEKVEKLERGLTSNGMLIADFGRHINDTDCNLSSLSDRVSKLDSKLAVTAQIVDTINSTISGYGHDYVIIADRINELEKKVNEDLDWKDLTGTTVFESIKNGILDSIKRLEEDSVSNDIQDDPVNHPKHYTDGKYECIDFIEEYGMVTHVGNAIKYISRNGKKDTSKYAEDLNKAFWYLHRYNTPQSMGHINAIDYCHEKKLPIELAGVIIDISHGEYKHAEELLGDYITKITGKAPKALEDEQSK